ncbi:hypothetical protein CYG48_19055 (plasmid) [Neorhizobium sp. SOG26]|jgi:hypothetical protein|uniref:tripartite tricarboxylate transporter TctB family protein n=1 Tax=Neorhizobium sp. SOG26 TaxID=2060726 RepID=UPI000E568254|nr:tripartite tricarboxylate transporter TctB family protein [Neorhizobium sp. SOG26]AXV17890.1 hypothetical protein CYG48_19055 [Neorhizobium sp. SOG26]
MLINKKDGAAGLFFVAVGLLYGGIAWSTLPFGSALRMGPGYFPIVLSGILVVLGAVIFGRSFFSGPGMPFGIVPWRGLLMILLATVIFAAFIDDLGMIPGLFVTTLVATLARPQTTIGRALGASIGITAFCTLVFSFAVRLPIPVVGPVFDGLR